MFICIYRTSGCTWYMCISVFTLKRKKNGYFGTLKSKIHLIKTNKWVLKGPGGKQHNFMGP